MVWRALTKHDGGFGATFARNTYVHVSHVRRLLMRNLVHFCEVCSCALIRRYQNLCPVVALPGGVKNGSWKETKWFFMRFSNESQNCDSQKDAKMNNMMRCWTRKDARAWLHRPADVWWESLCISYNSVSAGIQKSYRICASDRWKDEQSWRRN